MASVNRIVGECETASAKCDSAFPIEVGDLLFQVPAGETLAGYARPASAMNEQGSQALTLEFFKNQFMGIALAKNGAQTGETLPLHSTINHQPPNVIPIATKGRARFPLGGVGGTTVMGGELISASVDPISGQGSSGVAAGALKDQVVEITTVLAEAIGRAVPSPYEIGLASTALEGQPGVLVNEIIVDFVSQVFFGGEPTPVSTAATSSSGAL